MVDRLVIVMTRIYSVSYLIPKVKEGARRWMEMIFRFAVCFVVDGQLAD